MSFSARVLLFAVRVYQAFFSALMPSACKFYPSCSHYAAEAVRVHGARHGSWLALRRVGRCHPFTRGGVDLVPDAGEYSPAEESGTGFTGRSESDSFCHSERSEESLFDPSVGKEGEILRFAQNDKNVGFSARREFCATNQISATNQVCAPEQVCATENPVAEYSAREVRS